MGQYYMIVNADKRERIKPYALGTGMKLMEWSYNRTSVVLALMNKIAEDWAGDRVYVVGDYAAADNPNEKCYKALSCLIEEFGSDEIYQYADENFEDVSKKCDTEYRGYRYIYNHATRQVIDLEKCPVEWAWYDAEAGEGAVSSIAPLPLLIAMGNDRGGGDFHSGHRGYGYVGRWCDTVEYVEVRKDPIPGNDYKKFAPDFTERQELIPYTEGPALLEEEKRKRVAEYEEMKKRGA